MRLNIEWISPQIHGYPLRTWVWHCWQNPHGIISGGWSGGFTLLGFHIQLTRDALWSGVTLSINLWSRASAERERRASARP